MIIRVEAVAQLTDGGAFELAPEAASDGPPIRVHRHAPPFLRAAKAGVSRV